MLELDFVSLQLNSEFGQTHSHLPFDVYLNLLTEPHLLVQHIGDALADGPVPLFPLLRLRYPLLTLLVGQLKLLFLPRLR